MQTDWKGMIKWSHVAMSISSNKKKVSSEKNQENREYSNNVNTSRRFEMAMGIQFNLWCIQKYSNWINLKTSNTKNAWNSKYKKLLNKLDLKVMNHWTNN